MNERDNDIRMIPVSKIVMEEGAEELMSSPDMQPYIKLAGAVMTGSGIQAALQQIAQLPLEKRYLWRIVRALHWAFADWDDVSVAADLKTLPLESLQKIEKLLRFRPAQFCSFLKAFGGEERMEAVLSAAIKSAKAIARPRF